METRQNRRAIPWVTVIITLFALAVFASSRTDRSAGDISYSSFLKHASGGQITQVRLDAGTVTGMLKNGQAFETYVPPADTAYLKTLEAKDTAITVEPPRRWNLTTHDALSEPLPTSAPDKDQPDRDAGRGTAGR